MRLGVKVLLVLLLLFPRLVLAPTIGTCSSNGNEWECEEGKLCVCEVYGDCTDGNLLVYKIDLANLLCAPPIIDGFVGINWDYCGNPEGVVRIMADCEEGQSEEEVIRIISVATTLPTTTSTTTTLPTTTSTTTTLPTTTTTVRVIKRKCPYECCVNDPYYYDKYCPEGFECVSYKCVSTKEEVKEGGVWKGILIVIILIVLAIVAILMLRKKVPKTYEELYRKWSKMR